MVLPEKDEETLAAEAEAEERARRVVRLKTDLEEAEEKTKKWGERAVRLTAALAGSCVVAPRHRFSSLVHPTQLYAVFSYVFSFKAPSPLQCPTDRI